VNFDRKWRSANKFFANPLPDPLWRWLQQPKLTQALQQHYPSHQLKVISQGMSTLLYEESILLPELESKRCWLREICHCNQEQPLIYGRVMVPELTYLQHADELNQLKNRPIGDTLLFKNPQVIRSAFHYAKLDEYAPFYQRSCELLGPAAFFYARYSIFQWQNYPLIITEIFQPDNAVWEPLRAQTLP
jgi:chorismate-pyruvate lyase